MACFWLNETFKIMIITNPSISSSVGAFLAPFIITAHLFLYICILRYSLSNVTHARVTLANQHFVHFYQDTTVVAPLYAARNMKCFYTGPAWSLNFPPLTTCLVHPASWLQRLVLAPWATHTPLNCACLVQPFLLQVLVCLAPCLEHTPPSRIWLLHPSKQHRGAFTFTLEKQTYVVIVLMREQILKKEHHHGRAERQV